MMILAVVIIVVIVIVITKNRKRIIPQVVVSISINIVISNPVIDIVNYSCQTFRNSKIVGCIYDSYLLTTHVHYFHLLTIAFSLICACQQFVLYYLFVHLV
jgi:hypothetical protein